MSEAMPCQLVSWGEFSRLCRELAAKIVASGYQADMIVAIGRGGYMPARLLSDLLGIYNLASFKMEHYRGAHKEHKARVQYPLSAPVAGQRVLLVDDVSDSGDTFVAALEHVYALGAPAAVKTAVLHHKIVSSFAPDLFAEKVEQWRWIIYPWAVTEDIASFIAAMHPRTNDVAAIADYLQRTHSITIDTEQITGALCVLDRSSLPGRVHG